MAQPRRGPSDLPGHRHGRRVGHLQHQRQPLPPDCANGLPISANLHQRVSDARRIQQRSMEEMATLTETVYGELLSQVRPRVIKTEAENERAIAKLEALDTLGRPLTREEVALADLLTMLIVQFEDVHYSLGHASPLDALRDFMEVRSLRQRDLIPIFGASSVVSDVLTGKRSIRKAHARKLAEFFHVPVSLFI